MRCCARRVVLVLLHLLLLLLLCLQHTLKSVRGVVARSVGHSVLSDGFVLYNRRDHALSGDAFHDVVSCCHLRHQFLTVNEYNSLHFGLLAREQNLETFKDCHPELERSQLSIQKMLPEPLLSNAVFL